MIDTSVQGTISYSTRGSAQKLLQMPWRKVSLLPQKKRKLKKTVIVKKENVKVVEVGEDRDTDIVIASK